MSGEPQEQEDEVVQQQAGRRRWTQPSGGLAQSHPSREALVTCAEGRCRGVPTRGPDASEVGWAGGPPALAVGLWSGCLQ